MGKKPLADNIKTEGERWSQEVMLSVEPLPRRDTEKMWGSQNQGLQEGREPGAGGVFRQSGRKVWESPWARKLWVLEGKIMD